MINPYDNVISSPIIDNKTIKDLLVYKGICCWWFIDFYLYEAIGRDDFELTVNSRLRQVGLTIYVHFHLILLPIYQLIYFFLWRFVEIIFNRSYQRKIGEDNKGIILYRFNFLEWRVGASQNDCVYGNIYHGNIVRYLSNKFQVICVHETRLFSILSQIKEYLHIQKNGNLGSVRSTTLINYWSYGALREENAAITHFKKIWDILDENPVWFEKIAMISGVNVMDIKDLMKYLILYIIPSVIWYNSIVEHMIKIEHPTLLVLTDEQTGGRGWLNLGKKYDLPTIGIQHGVITEHPAYTYHEDVLKSESIISMSCPIPTKTLVWGKSDYDLLVNEGFYPKESVIVTGNPRYDSLGKAIEMFSRDEFCKQYNIVCNNKLILWVTQSHGFGMKANHLYLMEVLGVLSSLTDAILIIKQHPSEGSIYTNIIQQYIHDYHLDNRVIIPDKLANTTEMVYVSDVVILNNSTTGQEAVAFHKPLIVMDFSKNPKSSSYVNDGVGVGVYKKGSLKITLEEVLQAKYDFSYKQNSYIKNHMYKIDGESSKRCADVIMSYLE